MKIDHVRGAFQPYLELIAQAINEAAASQGLLGSRNRETLAFMILGDLGISAELPIHGP